MQRAVLLGGSGGLLRRSFAWLDLPFRTTRPEFLVVLLLAKASGTTISPYKLA
jgi:hypothetical protein